MSVDALLTGREAGPPALRDGDLAGRLFESLIALSVHTYAQAAEARVAHFRTRNGDHEVDLIVERADGRVVAIEVKIAPSVSDDDVRHLRWLAERYGEDLLDAVVITAGRDGVAVVPAALLGPSTPHVLTELADAHGLEGAAAFVVGVGHADVAQEHVLEE